MADLRALHGLAAQHHEAGRLAEAESLYRQILAAHPNDAEALHGLGTVALAVNQPAAAVSLIGRAVAQDTKNAQFLINLGIAHSFVGQLNEAGQAFRTAVAAAPGNLDARYNLGLHLLAIGAPADAVGEFRRIVDKQPQNADALMNLGIACARAGDFEEGLKRLRRCLQLSPGNLDARFNLANVLCESGNFDEAEQAYRDLLAAQPDHAQLHYNIANLLRDTGREAEAEQHFRRAIALDPKAVQPLINLGNLLKLRLAWDEAGKLFRAAVSIQPNSADAWRNLAAFDGYIGDADAAAQGFQRAIACGADTELSLQDAVLLPVIMESAEQIDVYRRRMTDKLALLAQQPLSIPDPLKVGARPFLLAYHGLDDRPIMETLGKIYRSASPSLNFAAKHCVGYRKPAGRRLRIGFVSTHFYNHTIGRLNERLMVDLPRERFEVFVFSTAGTNDATSQRIAAGVEHFVSVAAKLDAIRTTIAAAELDVLYFTDIGMEPLTYFLAYARLAPVQCVSFGHPVTTGVSTVDYFMSSDLFERSGAEADYSERLVRLSAPPISFGKPAGSGISPPNRGPDFVCAQSLFKFHPDFDPIVGSILERCPGSELVVINGEHPHWNEALVARWRRTIPHVIERIRFVPRLSHDDFVALLASTRVALDTPHFCGGLTSFETFAMGTPLVTLETRYARGRITLGYYRRMGVEDMIAKDAASYIELAVHLARDDAYRAQMSERLLDTVGILASDPTPITEQAAFFEQAVAAAAN